MGLYRLALKDERIEVRINEQNITQNLNLRSRDILLFYVRLCALKNLRKKAK
jgi:hypothetical protein